MRKYLISFTSLFLLAIPVFAGPQLVTPAEAALPAGDVPSLRGITRGPTIEQISPNPKLKELKGPFDLKVRFQAHGNSTIDLSTTQILYIKSPTINLTSRLAPYTSEKGVFLDDTNIPPGEHTVVISVADSSGRRGTSIMVLNVVN